MLRSPIKPSDPWPHYWQVQQPVSVSPFVACPVCEGAGNRPADFYEDSDSTERVPCRTCDGKGVVSIWGEPNSAA